MKRLAGIYLLVIGGSCTAVFAQRSLNSELGLAMPSVGNATCILTRDTRLKEGQRISVITFDELNERRQRIVSAVIGKKDPTGCIDGSSEEYPFHAYDLRVRSDNSVLGIAVLSLVRLKRYGRAVRGDLNGDGREEQFRICWSSEGAHLTVWSGTPLKSKRLWHKYYYAGYDTQPNCTKKDYL